MTPANLELEDDGEEECRKEVGATVRLRRYSRGLLAACSGGGHIWSTDTLFKSEGPTQVSLLMINYLKKRLKGKDKEDFKKHTICYDNICNVDKLKVLRKPLPIEEPFPKIWQEVGKVID